MFIMFIITGFIFPDRANSCSCCPDSGAWGEQEIDVKSSYWPVIVNLKAEKTAEVFDSIDGEILGLPVEYKKNTDGRNIEIYPYEVKIRNKTTMFEFVINTRTGKGVKIKAAMPDKFVLYYADIMSKKNDGMIELFKEIRFIGKGTMENANIKNDITYKYLLQGYGSMCPSKKDFKKWVLIVDGTDIHFQLNGTFKVK